MDQNKEQFSKLLNELELVDIQLMYLESYKNQPSPEIPEDVSLLVNLGYPKDSPFSKGENSTIVFMPKYRISLFASSDKKTISEDSVSIFQVNLGYTVIFRINNEEQFDTYFNNEEIRTVFMKNQIDKILRPYLRQQYSDLANRHSLHVPALPLVR
ncbi:MAG: hypothetical protein WBI82_12020 [Sphaerochaeta sp.]